METQVRTFQAREVDVEKKWYLVDADGKTLGRLASEIAKVLRGKNKPIFTRHVDTGDFVVVINAGKVKVEGKRAEQKSYFSHTGYPGGQKEKFFKDLIKTKPEFIIENAVKGMIPHNRLGKRIMTKLKVYAGNEHPHSAQQPEILNF